MDADHFDDVARLVISQPSRRGVFGLAVVSLLSAFNLGATVAKKGKRGGHGKHNHKPKKKIRCQPG